MNLQLQDLILVQQMRCLLVGSCYTALYITCEVPGTGQLHVQLCKVSSQGDLVIACNSRALRSQDTCTQPTQCHNIHTRMSSQLHGQLGSAKGLLTPLTPCHTPWGRGVNGGSW